jgi:hypothetical protein
VLVSNNAADEHRRTTRGQIRAEIWTQHELSPFLFKLNPQSDGATSSNTSPFLAYAPNSEGSWYLRLTNEEHRKDLFSKLESNAQYISLRFLAALGCASVAWEKIR